jgi:hypothetical protein
VRRWCGTRSSTSVSAVQLAMVPRCTGHGLSRSCMCCDRAFKPETAQSQGSCSCRLDRLHTRHPGLQCQQHTATRAGAAQPCTLPLTACTRLHPAPGTNNGLAQRGSLLRVVQAHRTCVCCRHVVLACGSHPGIETRQRQGSTPPHRSQRHGVATSITATAHQLNATQAACQTA